MIPVKDDKKNLWVKFFPITFLYGILVKSSSASKEFACRAEDSGSIPGSGRSAGEGTGYPFQYSWASLVVQQSACNAGDLGLIPGLGRSPGGGNSYPL